MSLSVSQQVVVVRITSVMCVCCPRMPHTHTVYYTADIPLLLSASKRNVHLVQVLHT